MENVVLKIKYLNELGRMIEITDSNELEQRHKRVCDSIEEDLGITKPFSVGDIKVTLSVDDVQTIANGIIKKVKEEAAKKWLRPSEGDGQNAIDTYA